MKFLLTFIAVAAILVAQDHPQPAAQPQSEPVTAPGGAQSHGDKTGHATGEAGQAGHEGGEHAGGGHAAMPNEIWWKWANFAILAGVLGYMINKTAGPFFASRRQAVEQGIAGAAQMKADAESRADAIEKKIANLSVEVDALRRGSQDEMLAEGERLRSETGQALAKIQQQAQAEIASATKAARADLKAYSAELAVKLAENQIREQMDTQTQERLAASFVDDLKGKAALN